MDRRVKEWVYDAVEEKILNGDFLPGSRILARELAAELGVSRSPVGDALNHLERHGVIVQTPRYGAFFKTFSREELEALWELRILNQVFAESRAVGRLSPEQLADMASLTDILREYAEAGAPVDMRRRAWQADYRFHRLAWEAGGIPQAVGIIDDLRLILTGLYTAAIAPPDKSPGETAEKARLNWMTHEQLREAHVRTDFEAVRSLLRNHLLRSRQTSFKALDSHLARAKETERERWVAAASLAQG